MDGALGVGCELEPLPVEGAGGDRGGDVGHRGEAHHLLAVLPHPLPHPGQPRHPPSRSPSRTCARCGSSRGTPGGATLPACALPACATPASGHTHEAGGGRDLVTNNSRVKEARAQPAVGRASYLGEEVLDLNDGHLGELILPEGLPRCPPGRCSRPTRTPRTRRIALSPWSRRAGWSPPPGRHLASCPQARTAG